MKNITRPSRPNLLPHRPQMLAQQDIKGERGPSDGSPQESLQADSSLPKAPGRSGPRQGHAQANRRLSTLDGLRFGAAAIVVLYHYTYRGIQGEKVSGLELSALSSFTKYGYLGVDVFFIISGIVIAYSSTGRTFRQFVASRAARLIPASIGALILITIAVSIWDPPWREGVTVPQFLANATLVPQLFGQGYIEPVYWTLWAEIRFYAAVALMTFIGVTKRNLLWFAWVWLAANAFTLLLGGLGHRTPNFLEVVLQPSYGHYFCLGIAIYSIRTEGVRWANSALLIASSLMSVVVAGNVAEKLSLAQSATYQPEVAQTIVAAAIAGVLVCVFVASSERTARALKGLGELTYPLYLVHATIGYIVLNAVTPTVGAITGTAIAISIALFLAILVNRTFERPLGIHVKKIIAGE